MKTFEDYLGLVVPVLLGLSLLAGVVILIQATIKKTDSKHTPHLWALFAVSVILAVAFFAEKGCAYAHAHL